MISVPKHDGRSPRIDALSNIGRITAAARQAFRESAEATLSAIARRAGVGVATLYRHFPNRESLAGAVMEQVFHEEVEPLLAAFSRTGARREDLLDVADRVVQVLEGEWGVAASVGDLPAFAARHLAGREELLQTVHRAQAAGNLRADLDVGDVPVLLAMVITAPGVVNAEPASRRRYLSLLLDGLNPHHAEPLPARTDSEVSAS
ncbi:TetR/AcrR family transcriptional regulator [Propionicicella superfundia]|uniref:TetR/AcrR family transcriptional regulator n=1 Tax=Propionicicella superfundia TaxID=348582 RepID=UPI00041F6AA7|nr:TetR/AcrR family transcriptional regulator [Propionicicella superfundia]